MVENLNSNFTPGHFVLKKACDHFAISFKREFAVYITQRDFTLNYDGGSLSR